MGGPITPPRREDPEQSFVSCGPASMSGGSRLEPVIDHADDTVSTFSLRYALTRRWLRDRRALLRVWKLSTFQGNRQMRSREFLSKSVVMYLSPKAMAFVV